MSTLPGELRPDNPAYEQHRRWLEKHHHHTCPKCGYTETCAKKYSHVCGRCGHKWKTGLSPREQRELKRNSLNQQKGKTRPW